MSLQQARALQRDAYRLAMSAENWEQTRDALLKLIDAVDWMLDESESATTTPGATP